MRQHAMRCFGAGTSCTAVFFLGCVFATEPCARAQSSAALDEASWTQEQLKKLPAQEKPVRLFNGADLAGWQGQTQKYFSVQGGEIVAANEVANAPAASTYLLTEKKYRNFRLIFEAKLVTSEMHSGVSIWGQPVEKLGDPFSYMGHLVMFPSGYGYYDLYRRNSIYKDDGRGKRAGKQHDWNRMEILAIGSRIRHAVNGYLVADWTDPKPELCQPGPIGLQLHSNKVAQEVRFRGLVLTEDPQDLMVTVDPNAVLPAAMPPDTKPVAKKQTKATAAATSVGSTPPSIPAVTESMAKYVADNKAAGIVTMAIADGQLIHLSAVGKATIENDVSMKPDTLFAIASMTKPITATALMILVDEGKVQLDDPVSKFVPQFAAVKLKSGGSPSRPITVRDCLTHTCGVGGGQGNEGTLAETVAKMAARPLEFEPGSKWQYGPGLSITGRIVEVASGQSFESFLNERIFTPLGMIDTRFNPTIDQMPRMAKVYQPSPDKKSLVAAGKNWINDISAPRTPNPSGGLFSTAADLRRFYQAILNGGELDGKRIVSAKAVAAMTTVQTGDLKTGFTPGNGWGLGWCVVREPQEVSAALSPGSFGHGGAFGTQAWIDPAKKRIYVLLVQRTNFGNSDGSDIRADFQRLVAEKLDGNR